MTAVYIVVRKTTDWTSEATFRAQLSPAFAPLVALWDTTFDIPYRAFRQELKVLAARSHARVEGATVAQLADVPAGGLVAATDDDDWFAPQLARVVATRGDREGYTWQSKFLEVRVHLEPRPLALARRVLVPPGSRRARVLLGLRLAAIARAALYPHARTWRCTTNNYAFTKGETAEQLLASHIAASAWFDANPDRVAHFDATLSLQNRNLASITSLGLLGRGTMNRALLLRKYGLYKRLYAQPAELAWAQPYVERMAALMDALHPR